MRITGRTLVVAGLVLAGVSRCGGALDGDEAPDDVDAACVPGAPACPPSDASTADHDAAAQPDDGSASDGGDAPAIDAGDAPVEAESDSPACTLPDSSSYACDPLAQCGCGFGMACDLLKFTSTGLAKEGSACRPAGIAKPYTHCAQDEDCRPGFTCILENCRRICAADSECDGVDPYRKCVHFKTIADQFGQSLELAYGYCVAVCDPIWPTTEHDDPTFVPCGPGLQCLQVPPAWVEGASGLSQCMNWSDKPRLGWGAPCKGYSECEPGFACEQEPLDGGLAEPGPGARVCRRWCEVGSTCISSTGTWPCTPVGLSAGPIALGLCPL